MILEHCKNCHNGKIRKAIVDKTVELYSIDSSTPSYIPFSKRYIEEDCLYCLGSQIIIKD